MRSRWVRRRAVLAGAAVVAAGAIGAGLAVGGPATTGHRRAAGEAGRPAARQAELRARLGGDRDRLGHGSQDCLLYTSDAADEL